MLKQLLFLRAIVATNLRASLALKTSFLLQCIFMIVNNLIFFTVWWIYFSKFEHMNGWGIHEVEAMSGITYIAFGLSVVFCGGYGTLYQLILDGQLDSYLIQPKNTLLQIICSKSKPSGWGDIAAGIFLILLSGYWNQPLVILFSAIGGCVILISFGIICNSLAFWIGQADILYRQLFEFLITFAVYPQSIFSGWVKVILFTILPAAYISHIPVELLRQFTWDMFALEMAAICILPFVAHYIFKLGLYRYVSGSHISVRT